MAMSLGISMERMGSGTTWIPDAVRLPSSHFSIGSWMVMLHGFAFGQYDWQEGPRGSEQFGSLNWAMVMADRPIAGGRIQLRFMPSLDPWTVTRCGYPLLLQSGETCNGEPLVDRQHPHDFFMELGALYEREITRDVALLLYAAPAGEPALGPVAFMHRPSAMDEPQAPLGHHWQDATHISFGVATVGLFTKTARLEFSAFNGREPDEERWNMDLAPLTSYSGRITVNPTRNLSVTAGFGVLDNPERAPVPETVTRFVTSVMHGISWGEGNQWATSLVFGSNRHEDHDPSASVLLESQAVLGDNTIFGRVERVTKSAHDLDIGGVPDETTFGVSAASIGYIRDFVRAGGVTIGVGARATLNFVPGELASAYGSRTPRGAMVFIRLRPRFASSHSGMPGM